MAQPAVTQPSKAFLTASRSVTLTGEEQQHLAHPRPHPHHQLLVTSSLSVIQPSPAASKFDPAFLVVKYLFIILNLSQLVIESYLLYITEWEPENSLIILGLIFGEILSMLAILGSLREECYLVLTYSMAVCLFFIWTLFSARSLSEELCVLVYLAFCGYFAFLLYRRGPPMPLI